MYIVPTYFFKVYFTFHTIDLPALLFEPCHVKSEDQKVQRKAARSLNCWNIEVLVQRRVVQDRLSVGVFGCSGFSPHWPASRTPPSVSRSPG